jgi:hypothetical protein
VAAVPPGAVINLYGVASSDGLLPFNLSLSCHRLERARAIVAAQGKTSQLGKTEAVGIQGVPRDSTFRAVFLEVMSPGTARTFRIVVKSFIRPIGTGTGVMYCPFFGFDALNAFAAPTARLVALAAATDLMFSEMAPTDAKDRGYRLFSAQELTVTCRGGVPIAISPSALDTDVGPEAFGTITPPPLTVFGIVTSPLPGGGLRFRWSGAGRPASAAEPAFQIVCPRTSVFIWHSIEGEVDCAGVRITAFAGSRFPTHQVYVDGVIVPGRTIPQGPFSDLWVPSTASPAFVR